MHWVHESLDIGIMSICFTDEPSVVQRIDETNYLFSPITIK